MAWNFFWTLVAQGSILVALLFFVATCARVWYVLFFGKVRQDSYDIFHGTSDDS